MKRVLKYFLFLILLMPIFVKADNNKVIDVYLFYSRTCQHCSDAKKFLKNYEETKKTIDIHYYEVSYNKQNAEILENVQDVLDNHSVSVPYIVIGSEVKVGFGSSTGDEIDELIKYYQKDNYIDIVEKIISGEITEKNISEFMRDNDLIVADKVKIPLLGEVNVKEFSLPLMAIVIGLVDGFNPCAMWVLIFLISMLVNMKDRKRMWILGLTFLITSALVYAGMMGAWLKIVINFASIKWIQLAIGIIALIGAVFNFRSYYLEKKKDAGCQVVDEKKRKKVMTKIKKFTSQKSFILALFGILVLAISVNILELACSAGLPVLFTNVLALNGIAGYKAVIYVAIYILFFLLDDIIVFSVAAISFKVTGITTKYTKISHLIGAIIMTLIGVLMIIKPEWVMFNF